MFNCNRLFSDGWELSGGCAWLSEKWEKSGADGSDANWSYSTGGTVAYSSSDLTENEIRFLPF